ncbi:hypothetical protein ACFYVL_31610 [Streptomyces sp. NPDC004111]|uniref:hypothetical protein n=1 Tax=Streptomyces sp. NPDC004111 TaxID=3364690 RepID=UPI0036C16155
MSVVESVFQEAATVTAVTGLVYTSTVLAVAAAAVVSRDPQRRRDARATLTILTRRTTKR